MSDKRLQASQNKHIRGQLLMLLEQTHPNPTLTDSIASVLMESGLIAGTDIATHVEYLRDRGYVTVTNMPSARKDAATQYLKLTSAGIDLLEETTTDAGVEL